MRLPIKGYEGLYDISDDGRVWSYRRNKWLKNALVSTGYPGVDLCKGGIRKQHLIHRLLAATFMENPKGLAQINHKNGIKTDNRLDNLEWCSIQENLKHALETGLRKSLFGESHGRAKLKTADVLTIRALAAPNKDIAKMFSVSETTVRLIRKKDRWAHIN